MLTIGIADKKAETKRIEKEQTCHGLHKVTDIDDLLLQVYNNLDSHCLFYMPREELSKAWGIPVFDNNDNYEAKYSYERMGEGLFIARYNDDRDDCDKIIYINKTKKYNKIHHGFGGSFKQGTFPKYLPLPKMMKETVVDAPLCNTKNGDYGCFMLYSWNKSKRKRAASILIDTSSEAELVQIQMRYCNFNP